MRLFLLSLPLLALILTPTAAQAQDKEDSLTRPGRTVLHISATERLEAEQDTLIASLRYEFEDKNPQVVQAKINNVMKSALAAAKKVTGVDVNTDQYYVHRYDPNPQRTRNEEHLIWKGQQGLTLKSKDSEALLKLAGDLQDMGLIMSGLNYTLSTERAAEIKDALMEDALAKLTTRANRAGKALGRPHTELVEVSVEGAEPSYPQPYMARGMAMEMAAADSAPAPVAEPGRTEITLTVSAKALLTE